MNTLKRKADIGEKIVIMNPQKGWNAHNDELKETVMVVSRVVAKGVYTKEIGIGFRINHDGYEVVVD